MPADDKTPDEAAPRGDKDQGEKTKPRPPGKSSKNQNSGDRP
jgi:hypothetical protein